MRRPTFLALGLACCLTGLSSLSLQGQLFDSMHAEQNAVKFSPAETAVLDRLKSLQTLPSGSWRFHEGDVPHGELPSLDDSSWQEVQPKSEAGKEAVWYRRTVEIPKTLHGYDLTGAEVSFRFRANANGPMPEIIYFNGRRVALGDDLEQVQLFSDAKPGEKVLVAVKLLPTVDVKRFDGVDMKISFTAKRPNPEDLRTEFVSAGAMVPSLAPGSEADRKILTKAVGEVDLKALDAANQAKFDASLRQAQTTLSALRPLLQTATFHLTGNSHIDAAWLWPWEETVDTVKRTFGSAVQLMSEYPTYTYTQSAAVYSQWMADKYPDLNRQIAERVKEGRWELVGGMWLEPDLNMPDGESLVRQILIGQETFQKLYGKTTRIGWNPDSFGYNWQLPQIYKRSGIDYFVTQKMHWNDTNQLPLKLFWWESPDGSKVLAYFPHDYANNNLDPTRLSRDMASARDFATGLPSMLDLYGVGDHGGGPTRTMLDEGLHWMEKDKVIPHEEFGTAQPYFTQVEGELNPTSPTWDYKTLAAGDTKLPAPPTGEITVPTWKDELYFEYHRGVFTTQADHKRNMRNSEEWVLDAEKYASLAWLDGQKYPADEISDAWKHVLFNQFHDLAAGSGIGIIYKEAQKDYNQVRWATNEVSTKALDTLTAQVDTRAHSGVPVVVFNSLGWQRGGLTEVSVQLPTSGAEGVTLLDEKNHVVPSQVLSSDPKTNTYKLLFQLNDVPSLGYVVLHAEAGKKDFRTDLKSSDTTIENDNLRVVVDPQTGCITSLFDKKTNFETIAKDGCGNELQTFKDTPKDYDAWNVDPGTYDVAPTLLHSVDSVKLVEQGPLRSVIRVARTWQSSKFTQDITLYAGADHAIVSNDIDWHETHVLLKASFPLAASSDHATFEIPYGTIDRPTTRNNSFEKAKFEVPAMRWADLGDGQHGFSLLNNSKYGYDAVDNLLRLTLLRSPTWPDPDADREEHHFSYALYPHGGDWKQALTVRHGYEFNYDLKAMQVQAHSGEMKPEHSFASIDKDNVVLTALKKTESGDGLIVRFYEWAGKGGDVTLTVPPGATSATLVNLMEKPEGEPIAVSGDKVTVPVTPFEIQTVQINYKPAPAM
ncbi:alpha-mannosidase [Granulicella arctica]|uniref:Alpha-mannosidase n=1 Tax=Granulicella arctica TaxID=940613 RepID=A0A7Y9TFK3_9BACT|nr:glycoside hydrolase family 38 C-terminal domain-containing protein [Granulicella arctica]NYF78896.1 alpha-mannosidase [Granulicella arctica]